jgi:mannosyltransferase
MSATEYQSPPGDRRRRAATAADAKPAGRLAADAWIVAGLVVAAAAIRFASISSQSYWADEALTAYEAQLPFGAMVNTVAHVETTPPLYFVLIWLWAKVFGNGEAALRSFSALAGIATVPVAYLAARELFSRWAGVVAAALVALDPFLIWYSQEARSYILLVALSGASFLFFVRARTNPTRRNLVWWVVLSALALATHFFAGFLVIPEAMWLLWRSRAQTVKLAVAAVALAQVAMLPFALIDTGHGAEWVHLIPVKNRIAQVPLEFAVSSIYRRATIAEGLIGGLALTLVVAALIALRGDFAAQAGAKVAGAIAAVAILTPLALGLIGPDYFLARNVMPAMIPLAAVIAAACSLPRARLAGGVLTGALLAMFIAATIHIENSDYLQRPDWRDVARAIGEAPQTRGILAAGGSTANPLKLYLPHVNWVQPHTREVAIGEVDVVGTRQLLTLASEGASSSSTGNVLTAPAALGVAIPALRAPPGTTSLGRVHVKGWVIARFALGRPLRIDVDELAALAPRFFHHAPVALLTFIQQPGR